jgi:hypothetical protein
VQDAQGACQCHLLGLTLAQECAHLRHDADGAAATVVLRAPEAFCYYIGNRSALEWIIDQYTVDVSKDGLVSDPNREEDPEFIVRLIGQIVRVSVDTVRIVSEFKD